MAGNDLLISGCSANTTGTQIVVGCSRWSRSGFENVIEFWCSASQRNAIYKNITPKCSNELYNILGTPTFYDVTFSDSDTLKIKPVIGVGNLYNMRSGNNFAVNDYSEEIVTPDTYHIKISCFPVDGYVD